MIGSKNDRKPINFLINPKAFETRQTIENDTFFVPDAVFSDSLSVKTKIYVNKSVETCIFGITR